MIHRWFAAKSPQLVHIHRFAFRLAMGLCLSGFLFAATGATLPPGFTENLVSNGLSSPTAMDFTPDGRLFVCLQGGQLRVIKNGALLATPFVTITVDSSGERGLLGVTFDPNFASNNFVYVYYTVPGSPPHNRVSRFTANGDIAAASSEMILLELNNLSATNHNGGAIHFGPDGKLYIAVGENANTANSQTLGNLLGKVLRINSDGTIPTDNPFFNTATGNNRAIWTLGLRNPFTFAFQPGTGRMFINDVGQSAWEEINDGIAGSNYGWPATEGPTSNPNFRTPLFSYGHGFSGTTGCAIVGGGFYNPGTVQFPASFVGKYFFADLCSGWVRVFDPSNNTAADFATGINQPVDLKVAADGSLYYASIGSASVFRIRYTAGTDPSITAHPSNQTVLQGQSATFTVTAAGSTPLSYQWQRNMTNISGATASSYTLMSSTLADNGAKFRCVVTNAFGTATSNEATLTINAPPNITGHPANQNVVQGQPATFGVTAGGSPPLSYQWQRNMTNISGATSSSYTIATTTVSDNGAKFRCVVSNGFGTATSNEATLTVNAPPNITGHPANQTVGQGQPATFGVTAGGSPPLSYQWQRNMTNISGATSSSYTIATTTVSDNGAKFRCVVSNGFGTATSNEATLTVQPPPPVLLTEEGTDSAIALASIGAFRDPFPLIDPASFGPDNRTRVILFGINLDLLPGEDSTAITARAEDARLSVYPMTIEFVGKVPNFAWLTEVMVRLPDNLPTGQDVWVSLTLHGQTSNKARIRIR